MADIARASAVIRKALAKNYSDLLAEHTYEPTDYISTRIPTIDYALATPGIACGRVTTIYGPTAAGKSTLLHSLIAETQRRGGIAVLVETEDAIDPLRMTQIGVDMRALQDFIFQPSHVEQAIDLISDIIDIIRKDSPNDLVLIGWDSVAATPIERETESESGTATFGAHSRLLSQGLRKLTRKISKNRIALVLVNQVRTKQNVMSFADADVMIADAPIRFHSTHIIRVRRAGTDKIAGEAVGIEMAVKVMKSKLGPSEREANVHLSFADGFDVADAWLSIADRFEVFKKNGAWYKYGERSFQKKDWPEILSSDETLRSEIETLLAANLTRAQRLETETPGTVGKTPIPVG